MAPSLHGKLVKQMGCRVPLQDVMDPDTSVAVSSPTEGSYINYYITKKTKKVISQITANHSDSLMYNCMFNIQAEK